MKDYLKNIVFGTSNKLFARGKAVEYCQEKILQSLQEKGAFQYWVFHGGTALRFLYALPRYSEGLDFTLADRTKTPDFRDIIQSVKRAFEVEEYNVQLKINDEKADQLYRLTKQRFTLHKKFDRLFFSSRFILELYHYTILNTGFTIFFVLSLNRTS